MTKKRARRLLNYLDKSNTSLPLEAQGGVSVDRATGQEYALRIARRELHPECNNLYSKSSILRNFGVRTSWHKPLYDHFKYSNYTK